jgi:hypothetical protein
MAMLTKEPDEIVAPTLIRSGSALTTAAAAGAACVGLAMWSPGDDGIPLCPTRALTGIDCPFCGGLRAVSAITKGDLLAAADHNVVVLGLMPMVLVWWALWIRADRQGKPMPRLKLAPAVWAVVLFAILAFTVVRNMPFASWLYSDLG